MYKQLHPLTKTFETESRQLLSIRYFITQSESSVFGIEIEKYSRDSDGKEALLESENVLELTKNYDEILHFQSKLFNGLVTPVTLVAVSDDLV